MTPLFLAALLAIAPQQPAPEGARAVIVRGDEVRVSQPPPHRGTGLSTADRISDAVPGRLMEFRRRVMHAGASIGLHPIAHDEVYYVISGEGEVTADGETHRLRAGDAAYLFDGQVVGIRQVGEADLDLIIAYPLATRAD